MESNCLLYPGLRACVCVCVCVCVCGVCACALCIYTLQVFMYANACIHNICNV